MLETEYYIYDKENRHLILKIIIDNISYFEFENYLKQLPVETEILEFEDGINVIPTFNFFYLPAVKKLFFCLLYLICQIHI